MHLQFASLATQLESLSKLGELSQALIAKVLTHTDDVLVVSWDNPTVEIPDMVLANGYTFFDSEYDPLYTVTEEDGLDSKVYGLMADDSAWFLNGGFGAYGYLGYVNDQDMERVLLVIRG